MTYQAIEHLFQDIPGVRTLHFGAATGLDLFGHVKALFVIGRPLAAPDATTESARAIFCDRVIPQAEYAMCAGGALLADGTGLAIETLRYASAPHEAMRAAVTDAGVVQAIGRARAVNRTATDPLECFVFADVLLPFPVAQVLPLSALLPDAVEEMLVKHSVATTSPTDATTMFPELFETRDVARTALDPARITMPPRLGQIMRYRRSGKGQSERRAVIRGDALAARAVFERRLGALALWEAA